MKTVILLFCAILLLVSTHALACGDRSRCKKNSVKLVVLGVAQDAGYPQLNCYQPHCMPAWEDKSLIKHATSLGVIDEQAYKKYLFEATPDIKQQMHALHKIANDATHPLAGIFLTHAHIGHYTGLMHLGREAAGTQGVAVYAMPKMREYLKNNGPWSQLVKLNNIALQELSDRSRVYLSKNLSVTPFLVPHRDEFSETVGFKIQGPSKTALFIPDINKWQKWNQNIIAEIRQVDYALLDATFYQNGEIPNRDMSEIPHPFVTESLKLFEGLTYSEKNKIIFIHINHSNPLLNKDSEATKHVLKLGFKVADEGLQLEL